MYCRRALSFASYRIESGGRPSVLRQHVYDSGDKSVNLQSLTLQFDLKFPRDVKTLKSFE